MEPPPPLLNEMTTAFPPVGEVKYFGGLSYLAKAEEIDESLSGR